MIKKGDSSAQKLLQENQPEAPSTSGHDKRQGYTITLFNRQSHKHIVQDYNSMQDLLDCSVKAENMSKFQTFLNRWILTRTGAKMVAVLLKSRDKECCFCKVCNQVILDETFYLGLKLLTELQETTHSKFKEANSRKDSSGTLKSFLDIKGLDQDSKDSLKQLIKESGCLEESALENLQGSIILIETSNTFAAALLLIHRDENSRHRELSALEPYLNAIGAILAIVDTTEAERERNRQMQESLDMAQNVVKNIHDFGVLNSLVMQHAKKVTRADQTFLFIMDHSRNELLLERPRVEQEDEETEDEEENEKEIGNENREGKEKELKEEEVKKINLRDDVIGLAGHAALSAEFWYIENATVCPYYEPEIDQLTEFAPQTIICYPVKSETGNLLAIIELYYGSTRSDLNEREMMAMREIAAFYAQGQRNCLYLQQIEEAQVRVHLSSEYLIMDHENVNEEEVASLAAKEILPTTSYNENFNDMNFAPRSIGTEDTYLEASQSMFMELGYIEKYAINRIKLARFLLLVRRGYREVPYHNWSHAFAVAHFTYLLLRTDSVRNRLSEMEQLALFVGSFCHDIDHRGTTNRFQQACNTRLSRIYPNSVMERHHLKQTNLILVRPEYNILENLTPDENIEFAQHLSDILIATDIAVHMSKKERIENMVEGGYDEESSDHRFLLKGLCITAADLSDQSKDFHNSKMIATSIYREFFAQGDMERFLGFPIQESNDRENAFLPNVQLGFLDGIGIPAYRNFAKLVPEARPTYEAILYNRRAWATMGTYIKEHHLPERGFEYLSDDALERQILGILDREDEAAAAVATNAPGARPTTANASALFAANN